MKNFLYKLPRSIAGCYAKKNTIIQLISFLGTYLIVVSGFDWYYFLHTRAPLIQTFLFPAVIIGFLLPVFLPLMVLAYGYVSKNFSIKNAAYALGQAGILGWVISSTYKVFTGRTGLPHGTYSAVVDLSQGFRFGFYRGGAFQGWPSSHTCVAFAMSFALITLYPKNKPLIIVAFLYALYIGIGVSTNIHWFADFFAGAIIGTLIGISVGKVFHARLKKTEIL